MADEIKPWSFEEVEKLPPKFQGIYSVIIDDFLKSGLEIAIIHYDGKLNRVPLAKAGQGRVRVVQRKNQFYLVRLEKVEEVKE